MNITSPNQLLYRVPPGRDTSGGRTASDRKTPTPVKVSAPQLRDGTDAAVYGLLESRPRYRQADPRVPKHACSVCLTTV